MKLAGFRQFEKRYQSWISVSGATIAVSPFRGTNELETLEYAVQCVVSALHDYYSARKLLLCTSKRFHCTRKPAGTLKYKFRVHKSARPIEEHDCDVNYDR